MDMNIFTLDVNPQVAAHYHCDKHVVKMILETAQMLSTAHHIHNPSPSPKIYKQTHKNHPSTIWVRQNNRNYLWTAELFKYLLQEYTYRYKKVHKTNQLVNILEICPSGIPVSNDMTPFAQCMLDQYKIDGDPIQAYKNYYIGEKKRFAKWTERKMPNWFEKSLI